MNVSSDAIREDLAKGTQARSDQLHLIAQLPGPYVSDKMISTHLDLSEQTIPTKDISRTDLSVNTLSMKSVQLEAAASRERYQSGVDVMQEINELGEVNYSRDARVADKKMFERIEKVSLEWLVCSFPMVRASLRDMQSRRISRTKGSARKSLRRS